MVTSMNTNIFGSSIIRGLGRGSRSAPDLPWGNTNRVVSNRVVSKGPLYPSKTEISIFVVF